MKTSVIILALLSILLFVFGCTLQKSALMQPDKQPYKFKNVLNFLGDHIILSDLDSNGFTEIITIHSSLPTGQPESFIKLMTFEGKIIEQINYPGRIVDGIVTLDYNDDGIQEILIPFVRNDSLFVSFVNARGEKLFYFFLIDGKPRFEDGGTYSWDPAVRGFYVQDLDNDGVKELITVVTTGYARLPRGILVHSIPNGKLIDKKISGSPPRDNFLDDFDGDGELEILCLGTAPNNGANTGGFDDQHSYLILYDLKPDIKVANWDEICKKYSTYILFYEDFDGDSKKELMACTESYSERILESRIVELDPVTFKEIKKRSFNPSLTSVILTNLNHDIPLEVVAIQSQREIVTLNNNLAEIDHHLLPFNLHGVKALPDVDNDGIDEIVVSSSEGDFLLDSGLNIKASFPGERCVGVIRRGENLSPQMVVRENDHYEVGLLIKNRFYLVKRFYQTALYSLACFIFIVMARLVFRLSREKQLLSGVQSMTFDSDSRGFVLFDLNQRIYLVNRTLGMWLGMNEFEINRKSRLENIFFDLPDILTFFNDTICRPPHHCEKNVMITFNNRKRNFQLLMDPMSVKKKTFWLVTLVDKSIDDEILQAKTWCKMAQKTAHDIKNPLSAIMLTLQRLQMLNQEQSRPSSEKFDLYVSRVIERIESLRRISKNFMKFVNIETLNFINTDLKEFLNDMTKSIRPGLPTDIQLEFQPKSDLPMVKIDQDAIRSVIENLVSNSINAMPEGGKIAIASQFLQRLTFPGNGQTAKDYVLIEVLDTGTGISANDCEHLFEPDFTRTEHGNGLGLAYVKKTVDDHKGYIEVESEPGAGTAISIYIPTL